MKPGAALGSYRIQDELGSGGMGTVYAAVLDGRCPGLEDGARVALKIVHPHLMETPGFFKRFLREGEIGRAVRHPNVVRTFDCDQVVSDGAASAFLVMELVEGQTLRELLDELESVPEALCLHVAREVCKGLVAIHACGVIHRDIKPDNILITADQVVKVMDLGVARLQDEALRLSQTGAFVGSIHYAAPEAFRDDGRNVDGRADLHALGLVLYELACGVNPYLADSVPQVLRRVLHEVPRRLGEVNPQLSPFFEEVVHCLLAKEPGERFADAAELLLTLSEGEESPWWHARARTIRATTSRPLRRMRVPRDTAVYGRDTELATLRERYEQARSGDGRVVLLEGEAGIGKTRLVDELVAGLQRDGEDINFLFGSYPPGGAATVSGAFSAAFHEHLGDAGAGPYLAQTPLLVTAFDALLAGDAPPPGAHPLNGQSIASCFLHTIRGLAVERTTVVLIDDLHFAPAEARALFTVLAMGVPGHRVLLVGTTRPGIDEAWRAGLTRLEHTTQIPVSRLGPKDLVELLRDSFRSEALASSLAAQIAVKSDGNPFFAFEIIQGLRDGQFITESADGTWVSTRVIDEIQIPSSVLDLVNARVADLSEEERDLLDVASCWGYEFDPALVGDVVGLARIPALKRFGQIERRHRLVRSVGRHYVFDHHQVQEALHRGLNEQLREEYHAALAEALETRTGAADSAPEALAGSLCVDLCEQYLKGARGAEALRYLAAAQTHLAGGYLHGRLVTLTERALAVPGLLRGVARAHVLLSALVPALDTMGRRALQEERVREARRLAEEADDAVLLRQAANALGLVHLKTARLAEAEEELLRAFALAQEQGDRNAETTALAHLGLTYAALRRSDEARASFEHAIDICREIGDVAGEAKATGNLGTLFQNEERFSEAMAQFERNLVLARSLGDAEGECAAEHGVATVLQALGRLPEAAALLERGLSTRRARGDLAGELRALGNLAGIDFSMGRLDEARRRYERVLELTRLIGDRSGEALTLLIMGKLRRQSGENDACAELMLAAQALCDELGLRHFLSFTLLELGSVRAEQARASAADHAEPCELLAAARDLADEIGVPSVSVLARCELALLPGGDAQLAIDALETMPDGPRADLELEARLLLWQATGDRGQLRDAKRALDESVAAFDDETRAAMLANLRVNRGIVEACAQLT